MRFMELSSIDVDKIIEDHYKFFESKKSRDIDFRINQLRSLKSAIKKYEYKIYEALYKDLGKCEFESYTTEVGFVLNSISHTIKNLKKWAKKEKVKTPLYLFPAKSFIISEPYGTVLIIGPYNYPFQLLVEPLVGALAAGNCVVLKPSENVPNLSRVITEMITETFPKEYIRSVEGGIETNTSLINGTFDYIFFTGSAQVGKIIMEAAARNLVPVTLELGGKSPVIVDESADIRVAAKRIIWGKTINVGQTCVAPDYVVVNNKVKDELIKELKLQIQSFYGKDAMESKDYGRIVNDRHFIRLKNILDKEADKIIYGGKVNREKRYIEPTLIDASWEGAAMSEEIFGPILPIISFSNLDEIIGEIKKLSKPLALYLFTENYEVEKKVLEETSSGGACINDTITHLANPELPFGGVGNSGIGAYHGKESFKTFSHRKSVVRKTTKINIPIVFPPFNKKNLDNVKKLMK
ncbi:MAG: aldehyde dehydrogenase [Clostridium sulfidigenes]|uniref:Aldehyde dehydrogenase n=1 Tax=Clostridium sulfidigenes TaxID=318464 RepID=A0A927WF88_9CLOT|nr:aldehyde dehydrogenase [Clostridium sulfidigenes]